VNVGEEAVSAREDRYDYLFCNSKFFAARCKTAQGYTADAFSAAWMLCPVCLQLLPKVTFVLR